MSDFPKIVHHQVNNGTLYLTEQSRCVSTDGYVTSIFWNPPIFVRDRLRDQAADAIRDFFAWMRRL